MNITCQTEFVNNFLHNTTTIICGDVINITREYHNILFLFILAYVAIGVIIMKVLWKDDPCLYCGLGSLFMFIFVFCWPLFLGGEGIRLLIVKLIGGKK